MLSVCRPALRHCALVSPPACAGALRRCRASLSYPDGPSFDGWLAIVVFIDGTAPILRMVFGFGCIFSASPNGVTSAGQLGSVRLLLLPAPRAVAAGAMLPSMTPLLNGAEMAAAGERLSAIVQGHGGAVARPCSA
jgi:hypothetical protein